MSISNISFFNGLGRNVKYVHADKFDLYVQNRYRIACRCYRLGYYAYGAYANRRYSDANDGTLDGLSVARWDDSYGTNGLAYIYINIW